MVNGDLTGNPGKRPSSDIDIETINSRKKRRRSNQESASQGEFVDNEVVVSPLANANLDPALSGGRNLFYQSDVADTSSDDDSLEVVEERTAPAVEPDFDLNEAFTESSTVTPTSVVDLSTQYSRDDVTNGNPAGPSIVDLEAAEQQVIEITDDEEEEEEKENEEGNGTTGKETSGSAPVQFKAARDYRCPICFDPPDTALITPCGHIFCCDCLFQMVNSSRTQRHSGHCALCRKDVPLRSVRMVILRKKRVKKET